jgi:hypothetical protein
MEVGGVVLPIITTLIVVWDFSGTTAAAMTSRPNANLLNLIVICKVPTAPDVARSPSYSYSLLPVQDVV